MLSCETKLEWCCLMYQSADCVFFPHFTFPDLMQSLVMFLFSLNPWGHKLLSMPSNGRNRTMKDTKSLWAVTNSQEQTLTGLTKRQCSIWLVLTRKVSERGHLSKNNLSSTAFSHASCQSTMQKQKCVAVVCVGNWFYEKETNITIAVQKCVLWSLFSFGITLSDVATVTTRITAVTGLDFWKIL